MFVSEGELWLQSARVRVRVPRGEQEQQAAPRDAGALPFQQTNPV